eukprot:840670-Amphidinium_carterae.1
MAGMLHALIKPEVGHELPPPPAVTHDYWGFVVPRDELPVVHQVPEFLQPPQYPTEQLEGTATAFAPAVRQVVTEPVAEDA